jgi:protein-L-isoaspartate(D-aspartate) O-methyltransferase
LTAIFSLLVGESGRAVGVEHIPELTDKAIENIKKSKAADLLASGCLTLLTGGWYLSFTTVFYPITVVSFIGPFGCELVL